MSKMALGYVDVFYCLIPLALANAILTNNGTLNNYHHMIILEALSCFNRLNKSASLLFGLFEH